MLSRRCSALRGVILRILYNCLGLQICKGSRGKSQMFLMIYYIIFVLGKGGREEQLDSIYISLQFQNCNTEEMAITYFLPEGVPSPGHQSSPAVYSPQRWSHRTYSARCPLMTGSSVQNACSNNLGRNIKSIQTSTHKPRMSSRVFIPVIKSVQL